MTQLVQIELDEGIISRAREVAERTGQPLEQVLRDWISSAADNLPVELLPDEQILALTELMMPEPEQSVLSDLLADNQSGQLDDMGRQRLNDLMGQYRRGLVRKAQALKVAVQRGLIPPLG